MSGDRTRWFASEAGATPERDVSGRRKRGGGPMSRLQSVLASVTLVGAALVPFALATTATPASAATVNVQPVAGTTQLLAVACPTATTCVAVGQGPGPTGTTGKVVPITNGVPGAPQLVTGTNFLFGVACSGPTTCVAVGRTGAGASQRPIVVPIVDGVAGMVQIIPVARGSLASVACSAATSCVAVGSVSFQGLVVPITNGIAGNAQLVPSAEDLAGVGCYGPTACVAVGSTTQNIFEMVGVAALISNGTAGVAQTVPGTTNLTSIACRVSVCEATGTLNTGQPGVVPFVDGVPGAPQPTPGNTSGLAGIACPTDTLCEAVGQVPGGDQGTGALVPVYSGVPAAPQPIPGTAQLLGIACTTATSCIAVGNNPDSTLGVVVTVTRETTPPTCFVSAVRPAQPGGPGKQLDLTAQDTGSGIATITVVSISNGTVNVPDFTPGTTSPVVITATKTDQTKPTVFNVDVTDVDGNTRHCR